MSSSEEADLDTEVGNPRYAASSHWCCSPLIFLSVRQFDTPALQEIPQARRRLCVPVLLPQFLFDVREASTTLKRFASYGLHGFRHVLPNWHDSRPQDAAERVDAEFILTQRWVQVGSRSQVKMRTERERERKGRKCKVKSVLNHKLSKWRCYRRTSSKTTSTDVTTYATRPDFRRLRSSGQSKELLFLSLWVGISDRC